jgi:hypothetical protein
MTPEALIADLDSALLESGEDIRLQRLVTGPNNTQLVVSQVDCRARVRGVGNPSELVAGNTQLQSDVIISPTEISAKNWPGPATSAAAAIADRRIPIKSDRVFMKGKPCTVEFAHGKYVAGVLVRIEMRVMG